MYQISHIIGFILAVMYANASLCQIKTMLCYIILLKLCNIKINKKIRNISDNTFLTPYNIFLHIPLQIPPPNNPTKKNMIIQRESYSN